MSSFIGSSFMQQGIILQDFECDVLFSNISPNTSIWFSTSTPLSAGNSNDPATPLEHFSASSSLPSTSDPHTVARTSAARADWGDVFGATPRGWRPLAYVNTRLGWGATAMLAFGLLTCALAAAFVFLARAHPLVRACSYGLTLSPLSGTAIELLVISM